MSTNAPKPPPKPLNDGVNRGAKGGVQTPNKATVKPPPPPPPPPKKK